MSKGYRNNVRIAKITEMAYLWKKKSFLGGIS